MIAIDHPIDNEPLLKFHMAVLREKENSILELLYVGGLIDSVIIILSLQTTT